MKRKTTILCMLFFVHFSVSQVINIDYISKPDLITDKLNETEDKLSKKLKELDGINQQIKKIEIDTNLSEIDKELILKRKKREKKDIEIEIIELKENVNTLDKTRDKYLMLKDKGNVQFLEKTSFSIVKDVSNFLPNLQLLKVNVGEPKGFKIPIFLFIGSPFNLKDDLNHEKTAAELLNPIGGLINLYIQHDHKLIGKNNKLSLTKLNLKSSIIAKYVSGTDTVNRISREFFNFAGTLDFFFQTGAWEAADGFNPEKSGVFWINLNFSANAVVGNNLKEVFTQLNDNSFLSASFGIRLGLYIEDKVNINVGYINNFTKGPIKEVFQQGVFKISTDLNVLK